MYYICQISSLDHDQKMSGDYNGYEEEQKTEVKRDNLEKDPWEWDDEQKLAMSYFQRVVKKSGCQHTYPWERMKMLPSWLRSTKKMTERDDLQRKLESSPKCADNALGNHYSLSRKVAG